MSAFKIFDIKIKIIIKTGLVKSITNMYLKAKNSHHIEQIVDLNKDLMFIPLAFKIGRDFFYRLFYII